MTAYERLLDEADRKGIQVYDFDFSGTRLCGLYCNGSIALASKMNDIEKTGVLAEEICHHDLSVGNIIDINDIRCRQQENIARMAAYDKLVGLDGLIAIYESRCEDMTEASELLDVSERFLTDALSAYSSKYGDRIEYKNYIIYLNPLKVDIM